MKKSFDNIPILDPDDYNPNDYEKGQKIRFKEGNQFLNAIITDIDIITGNMAVEFQIINEKTK